MTFAEARNKSIAASHTSRCDPRTSRRVSRHDPGGASVEHPTRPILLRQVGSRWEVLLSIPAARRYAPSRVHKRLDAYPADALVPVAKKVEGGYELKVGGTPARFAKADATSYAHKIGRYMLDMGDMVYTYVEERRASKRDPRPRRDARVVRPKLPRWDVYWWQNGRWEIYGPGLSRRAADALAKKVTYVLSPRWGMPNVSTKVVQEGHAP